MSARPGLAGVWWLSACLCGVSGAYAQSYPVKPIRIVVPFPPGGPNDLLARTLGQRLAEILGQAVIVDNRSGAAGNIGAQHVAASPPDGYTLLNGASSLTITPALMKSPPYDVLRDFAPISLTAVSTYVLAVHPSVPAGSIRELIALAKAHPGRIKYASSGVGAPPHLAGELLKSMAKIDILHVPYKGVGQSITDLVGGQVDMMFASPNNAVPQVKSGRLKALAVSTSARSPLLPEVPTISESGLRGFDLGTWFGLFAPAAVPPDLVNRLNTAVVRIVGAEDFRERISGQGLDPKSSSAAEFAALVKSEVAKFAKLVREARILPE